MATENPGWRKSVKYLPTMEIQTQMQVLMASRLLKKRLVLIESVVSSLFYPVLPLSELVGARRHRDKLRYSIVSTF